MVFNADDAGQIAEVKKQRALMPSLQLIATGGNLSAAMKTLGSQIFWDEKGHWSTTLKLTSLPALVTHQGGLALTVQMGLDNES